MDRKIGGVAVPILTPFDKTEEVDEDALRELVRFLMKEGAHLLIPGASTGEFAFMTLEERKRVIEIVMEEVGGKIPVIAGVHAVRTKDSVEMTRYAKDIGADGVMAVASYYQTPTSDENYRHYKAIAEIGLPVMMYNSPGTSKVDFSPETLVKYAQDGIIHFVKESTSDIKRVHDIIRFSEGELPVFAGCDDLGFESFVLGAVGWVVGFANFLPRECVELYKLTVEKADLKAARELNYRLLPIGALLEGSGKFVQYCKAGAELVGLKAGNPRKPLLPVSPKEKENLKKLIDDVR